MLSDVYNQLICDVVVVADAQLGLITMQFWGSDIAARFFHTRSELKWAAYAMTFPGRSHDARAVVDTSQSQSKPLPCAFCNAIQLQASTLRYYKILKKY